MRPCAPACGRKQHQFQSTHSLRSATRQVSLAITKVEVSIHALLAECDIFWDSGNFPFTGFNPRTPCGVRRIKEGEFDHRKKFQSTHSLRSATRVMFMIRSCSGVSIHALLAECDITERAEISEAMVSIHALLAECDIPGRNFKRILRVSIHALLAECDGLFCQDSYHQ